MFTTIKRVEVSVMIDGRETWFSYPIRTKEGFLMTHRLKNLLDGKIGRQRMNDDREIVPKGLVWRPPYTLVHEIMNERVRLQNDLKKCGYSGRLVELPARTIPEDASNTQISAIVKKELKLINKIRNKIAEQAMTVVDEYGKHELGPLPGPYKMPDFDW